MWAKQKSPLKIECFHPVGKCLKSNYTSLLVGDQLSLDCFDIKGLKLACSSCQDQGRKLPLCSKESRLMP